MRCNPISGPWAMLCKILASLLLIHLLVSTSSAYPFNTKDVSTPHLVKRSNCAPNAEPDALWTCDGDVPGVDETKSQVSDWGVVGRVPSVFYTGFPIGLNDARNWASCFFTGEPQSPSKYDYRYAIWKRIVHPKYDFSQSFWIQELQPDDVTEEDNKFYADMFLKHLAQGFAEVAAGEVYLVVSDDVATDDRSWDENTAWGGWEWPALTRNSGVSNIYRVDPKKSDAPRKIWSSSDGQQGNDPKGVRGSTQQISPRRS